MNHSASSPSSEPEQKENADVILGVISRGKRRKEEGITLGVEKGTRKESKSAEVAVYCTLKIISARTERRIQDSSQIELMRVGELELILNRMDFNRIDFQ